MQILNKIFLNQTILDILKKKTLYFFFFKKLNINFKTINFFFKNSKNIFFFISYIYKKNTITWPLNKINFFFFCYGLNNYHLIEDFLNFLKKKKKIVVILRSSSTPYLFKLLVRSSSIFFICDDNTYNIFSLFNKKFFTITG